jgi:hypothetical protein
MRIEDGQPSDRQGKKKTDSSIHVVITFPDATT